MCVQAHCTCAAFKSRFVWSFWNGICSWELWIFDPSTHSCRVASHWELPSPTEAHSHVCFHLSFALTSVRTYLGNYTLTFPPLRWSEALSFTLFQKKDSFRHRKIQLSLNFASCQKWAELSRQSSHTDTVPLQFSVCHFVQDFQNQQLHVLKVVVSLVVTAISVLFVTLRLKTCVKQN